MRIALSMIWKYTNLEKFYDLDKDLSTIYTGYPKFFDPKKYKLC